MLPQLRISACAASSPAAALGPEPAVWRDGNGRACAYAYAGDDAVALHLPGIAWYRLPADSGAITARPETGAADADIARAFHHVVLPLYLSRRGLEVLHGVAVYDGTQVIGFCAASGTGKTTLLHALCARGPAAWADDALIVAASADTAVSLALPPEETRTPRALRIGTRAPISALVLLERRHDHRGPPELQRLAPASAFSALLQHAYCLDLDVHERRREMIERYLGLCAQVPVWTLRYASGMERLREVVAVVERSLLSTGERLTAGER